MASMDISENSFQTPASKKRKASDSPSLPPASQPTLPLPSYKNRTPLIATGINPKFNTQIRTMSELRQYNQNLKVFQIKQTKQTKNGWIFIGDPKILPSCSANPKCNKLSGKLLRCHFQSHTLWRRHKEKSFGF